MVKLFIMIPWNPQHQTTKNEQKKFSFFFFNAVRFAPLKGYHFPSVNFFVFLFSEIVSC